MVKVRVSVRVVVRVIGFCPCPHRDYLPTECSANLQSAFYPWPVTVVVRYGASCSYVSSYTHLLIRYS